MRDRRAASRRDVLRAGSQMRRQTEREVTAQTERRTILNNTGCRGSVQYARVARAALLGLNGQDQTGLALRVFTAPEPKPRNASVGSARAPVEHILFCWRKAGCSGHFLNKSRHTAVSSLNHLRRRVRQQWSVCELDVVQGFLVQIADRERLC